MHIKLSKETKDAIGCLGFVYLLLLTPSVGLYLLAGQPFLHGFALGTIAFAVFIGSLYCLVYEEKIWRFIDKLLTPVYVVQDFWDEYSTAFGCIFTFFAFSAFAIWSIILGLDYIGATGLVLYTCGIGLSVLAVGILALLSLYGYAIALDIDY